MDEERDLGTKIDEDYIDRLAKFWPEPREQLHFGGWKASELLIQKIDFTQTKRVLDICCGEGGTARWLAKKYQLEVDGVDILEKAIKEAKRLAEYEGLSHLTEFKTSTLYKLPYPELTFDIIYGQDPDGCRSDDRPRDRWPV